jgi:uncharacterized protein (TIGR01777 family)
MRIVLAGASGFLGTALQSTLRDAGHELIQLVRREPSAASQVRWDPETGSVDVDLLRSADVVINTAGAPIAHWPWTDSYRRTLVQSRVTTTRTLASAIAGLDAKPALLNSSAIGFYGDRGDEQLDEDSPAGTGFVADLVQQWEAASAPAVEAGARVVLFRPGIVLDRGGSALKVMRPVFLLGLGARIGSGKQYFPTVSLPDYLSAVMRFVSDASMSGTYNLVGPQVATNAEFTRALGHELHRPTLLAVPAFALGPLGKDPAGELLGSINAYPRRLLDAGFEFSHPTVADQLRAGLRR